MKLPKNNPESCILDRIRENKVIRARLLDEIHELEKVLKEMRDKP
jgi:hypothetical protein